MSMMSFWCRTKAQQDEIKNFINKYKDESAEACIAKEFNMKPDEFWSNWNDYRPWLANDNLRDVEPGVETADWDTIRECDYLEPSDAAKEAIKSKYGKSYFLFSFDENPEWEFQEMLMGVSERHHLG